MTLCPNYVCPFIPQIQELYGALEGGCRGVGAKVLVEFAISIAARMFFAFEGLDPVFYTTTISNLPLMLIHLGI